MEHLVGIDGGGTRTTLALASRDGVEIVRRTGPVGLVDPRDPAATARMLTTLTREAMEVAGVRSPAVALCAGLAGVGNEAARVEVEAGLSTAGIADRVLVCSDGVTALRGAHAGGPGILLIAGTGSVGWGRAEDGRLAKCGGWGRLVGDDGSAYAMGIASLRHALLSVDGREPETRLLPILLETLSLEGPEAVPPWALRAEKHEVAALAVHAPRLAVDGDEVARRVVERVAADLAAHVTALASRLGPWRGAVPLALHGGLATDEIFTRFIHRALADLDLSLDVRPPLADAVDGALDLARALIDQEPARP